MFEIVSVVGRVVLATLFVLAPGILFWLGVGGLAAVVRRLRSRIAKPRYSSEAEASYA